MCIIHRDNLHVWLTVTSSPNKSSPGQVVPSTTLSLQVVINKMIWGRVVLGTTGLGWEGIKCKRAKLVTYKMCRVSVGNSCYFISS